MDIIDLVVGNVRADVALADHALHKRCLQNETSWFVCATD